MKKLFKEIIGAGLLVSLLIGLTGVSIAGATTTLKVAETPAVSVYTSQGQTDTTLVVTPVPVDLDGNVLTMSNFGSGPTVTVDPGVSGFEEIESFTAITNNGNNTATLSGITRDLQSVYPYTGTGTGKQHGGGAVVVFSNNPQLYGRLAAPENDNVWTGLQTYSIANQPVYNGNPTFTNPFALIDKAYADALSIVGAPTSTENGMGVVRLATQAQVGTGVASSTSGAPLVIENKFASTTYNPGSVFQGEIPALRSTKNIDPNFIATSTGDVYNFGGPITFTATTTMATSTVASTTITTANIKTLNILGTLTGQVVNYVDFLANGTWTKPASASTSDIVIVMAWGGGGSGGSNAGNGGGGGGGGACVTTQFRMSDLGSTETITIGAAASAGSAGNNTTFGSHFTAYGGGAGFSSGGSANGSGGGGGGALSGGSNGQQDTGSNAPGGGGGGPLAGTVTPNAGVNGGDSSFGGGGGGGRNSAAPTSNSGGASMYGGGGGGASSAASGSAAGGSSFCGGGGGGGGGGNAGAAGTSVLGGAGGNGGNNVNGVNGTVPGGGGGGAGGTHTGGNGAAGELRIWVIQ